ncbi:MAG: FHA domain-containing protein, partial [Propionibacteriaceae bacterium]|nr:FHA domain-containing protein [Propionibacteriaceae bacterium]
MKLRLDVETPDGSSVPVTVTAEGTATVADVAGVVWAGMTGVPADPGQPVTLQVMAEDRHEVTTLPGRSLLWDTVVCSGQRVRVVPYATPTGGGGTTAGWLRVISGPDAGKSFALRAGSQVIGRDTGCDIVLADQQVSRRYARLTMGPLVVEVADLNSSNGVVVGDTL